MKNNQRIIPVLAVVCLKVVVTIIWIFTFTGQVFSQDYKDKIISLEKEADSIVLSSHLIPGAAIAIVNCDSVLWSGVFGYADLKDKKTVSRDTRFCIGSCSKSFTGLAFLIADQEGLVNMDACVNEVAPEIPLKNPWSETDPVRIIHLLEHSSGFQDSRPNWFYFRKPLLSTKEALLAKDHLLRARWEPGTRYSYSSPGFTLAGYLLEKAAGKTMAKYLQEKIFEPAGMQNTGYGNTERSNVENAIPYDKELMEYPIWYDYDEPAGAVYSSIGDMSRFLILMLNSGTIDGRELISQKQFGRIGKPESTLAARSGIINGYGYGVGSSIRNGRVWFGHGGAVPGYLSAYYYCPELGIGFVILQNQFDMTFDESLISWMWKVMAEWEKRTSENVVIATDENFDPDEFTGYYEPCNPRSELGSFMEKITGGINVTNKEGSLFTQSFMGDSKPLIHLHDNLFCRKGEPGPTLAFVKDEKGKMIFISAYGYFCRVSKVKPILLRSFFFGSWGIILSVIPYFVIISIWILIRKMRRKSFKVNSTLMKLVPLGIIIILVAGIMPFVISPPTILEMGMKSWGNILLCISTILFPILTITGIYLYTRSYKIPLKLFTRIYFGLIYLALMSLSIYLTYWGIIGIRLWE